MKAFFTRGDYFLGKRFGKIWKKCKGVGEFS
jgi:hypothetical protein